MRYCSECGSWQSYPHCNNFACSASWCDRCGHESGECHLESLPEYPEKLEGDTHPMARYRPVIGIGRFVKGTVPGGALMMRVPVGWYFDFNDDAPDWPPEELFGLCSMEASIAYLPELDESDIPEAEPKPKKKRWRT